MKPIVRQFLRKYLPGKAKYYVIGLACLFLTIFFTTLIPQFLKDAINLLEATQINLSPENKSDLLRLAMTILLLGSALALFRFLSRIIIFYPGRTIESEIRQDYYSAISGLMPSRLKDFEPGDLVSRGTNDVTSVRVMLSMGILHSVNSVLMLVICFWRMFVISPKLTIFCLLPAPIMLVAVRFLSRKMMRKAFRMQQSLGQLSEVIREHLMGHALMQIFPIFPNLFAEFKKINQEYSVAFQEHIKVRTVLFLLSANLAQIASFLLVLIGAQNVIKGSMDIGSFVAFSSYLALMQDPLRSFGFLISILQRGEICLTRIYEIIDLSQEYEKTESKRKIQRVVDLPNNAQKPIIEVTDLKFPENPLPDGFQLVIPELKIQKGKQYGIFGRTGSGKSLLLSILSGNIDLPREKVFFKGTDYTDIHRDSLQKHLSVVTQSNKHFAKTIRENLDQVTSAISEDQEQMIRYSFEAAHDVSCMASDFSQFQKGIDSLLGENGINLSGGQRQRLALFRALIKPHELLFLDDIVSSVDHDTEMKMLSKLRALLAADETLIVISHRISALMACDTIFVMDAGKIITSGTHAELLRNYPPYKDTFEHQVLEAEVEG